MRGILGLLLLVGSTAVSAAEEKYVFYDEFIRQVEAGLIESVALDDMSSITGTMRVDDASRPFRSYARTGTANDPLLLALLREHGVEITIQPDNDRGYGGWFSLFGLLTLGVPVALLVLAVVINSKLNQVLANQRRVLSAPIPLSDDPGAGGH